MTSRLPLRVIVALSMVLSALALPLTVSPGIAQSGSVPPREFALTPADLPAGFVVEPDITREQPIEDIGLGYTIAMRTDPTPENVASGPVRVWQHVIRIDRLATPVERFGKVRDEIIADRNLGPFPGGVNNATSAQLIGQAEAAGQERAVYAVGRVRDNFIWFTLVEGAPPGTSIQSAISLNDVSMAKYERVRSVSGAPALADALFQASFLSDELPAGFQAGNIVRAGISDRALAHDATAEIDLEVEGQGLENLITFIVYPSEVQARASFEDAPGRATQLGSLLARPDGYPHPVLCAMRGGEVNGRKLGATSCLALVGNVEVSAFSLMENAEFGAMQDSLQLMEAGVKHLQKVTASTGTPR